VKKQALVLVILLLFAAWGTVHLATQNQPSAPQPGRTHFSVYTTGLATTPQIPFWKALADGDLGFTPEVHYWKNLDDLRGILLAGKGDIWIGHIDGFAQAARRGAPIQLACVSGWKKFHFLTTRPDIHTFEDIAKLPRGTEIASAPPHSPGVAVLRSVEGKGLPAFSYAPHEPKQLALKAVQGSADLLLLPEPLVTVLLKKKPELRVVASVEEEYGRLTGTDPVLPIAGIAVNTNTLKQHPELANRIREAMRKQEKALMTNPAAGLETLPPEFETFIPRPIVEASLERDVIRVRTAREAEAQIRDYLSMLLPKSVDENGVIQLPDTFFGGAE